MVITAAKPRRHQLTELFLDGEPYEKIATEIWRLSGLRVGDPLTEEALADLLADSERYRAKEKALYLLEYRGHSKKELQEKLERTVSREAAQEAVGRMDRLGLMDDEKYAAGRAASLFRKGYAAKRVVYELLQKGIDREVAQAAAEAAAPEPVEKIRELLMRKYPAARGDEAAERRAVAALQRLGYGYGEIRAALEQWRAEE